MARPSLAPGVQPSPRARALPAEDARTSLAARMVTWDRQASGWWSFLTSQGRSPAEIKEIIQDAIGPRPGGSDPAEESLVHVSAEAPPPSTQLPGAPAQLPVFQWGDRVPLPPPMNVEAHVWPHPLPLAPDSTGVAPGLLAAPPGDEMRPGSVDERGEAPARPPAKKRARRKSSG